MAVWNIPNIELKLIFSQKSFFEKVLFFDVHLFLGSITQNDELQQDFALKNRVGDIFIWYYLRFFTVLREGITSILSELTENSVMIPFLDFLSLLSSPSTKSTGRLRSENFVRKR